MITNKTFNEVYLNYEPIITKKNMCLNKQINKDKTLFYYDNTIFSENDIKKFLNNDSEFPSNCTENKKLDSGSHGIVKKCISNEKDKYVIKIIKDIKYNVYDFLIEILAMLRLIEYEYTPKILFAYVFKNKGYILETMIQGKSLSDLDEEVNHILYKKCCNILDVLYSKYNIVHGDGSLYNFMIDDKGKLYIIDFGSSILLNSKKQYQEGNVRFIRITRFLTLKPKYQPYFDKLLLLSQFINIKKLTKNTIVKTCLPFVGDDKFFSDNIVKMVNFINFVEKEAYDKKEQPDKNLNSLIG